METQGAGFDPTPEEAREALALADAEEAATINRPVPSWYFPLLAALVLAIFLLNALDDPAGPIRGLIIALVLFAAISVAVLVGRVSFRQTGYHGVRTSWPWTIVSIAVAAALAITPVLIADAVGNWIWIVCGSVLSALIAGFGIAYWKRYPRG